MTNTKEIAETKQEKKDKRTFTMRYSYNSHCLSHIFYELKATQRKTTSNINMTLKSWEDGSVNKTLAPKYVDQSLD